VARSGIGCFSDRELMLGQAVDGVSLSERMAQRTLGRVFRYAKEIPTVYLPSHDPGSVARLATRTAVRMEARVYEEPYARI
jgi:hypothetical protein